MEFYKNKIIIVIFIFIIQYSINLICSGIDTSKYAAHGFIRSGTAYLGGVILALAPFVATQHLVESIVNPLFYDKWKDNKMNKPIEADQNIQRVKDFAEELINNKELIINTADSFINDNFIKEYIENEFQKIDIGNEIKRKEEINKEPKINEEINKEPKINNDTKDKKNNSIINTKNALIATAAAGAGVGLYKAEQAYQKAKKKDKKLSRIKYIGNSLKSLFNSGVKSSNNIRDRIKDTGVNVFDRIKPIKIYNSTT